MRDKLEAFIGRNAGRLRTALAIFFSVILGLMFWGFRDINAAGYRGLSPKFLLMNIPVIAGVFIATKLLMRSHRIFRWSVSDLLIRTDPGKKAEASLLAVALNARYAGVALALLLALNLPTIALLEEFIFRRGTDGWTGAAWRSALFGLAHLTANVPVAAVVATSGLGLWFSYWYFQGGIELSGAVHFSYILVIVALSLPSLIRRHFRKTPSA